MQSLPQVIRIQVSIDFGSSYRFMSQHILDGFEVGASFDQVSGKGMSEGVRADGFLNPGCSGKVFDQLKHHDPGELFTPQVKKENVFVSGSNLFHPSSDAFLVKVDMFKGHGAYRYYSFFIVFADHF